MVIVIDNYDSFTYNLVQYLAELGAEVKVFRNDAVSVKEVASLKVSHVVISPGPGRPEDAGISVDLVKVLAGTIPILGVCLGHQAIALAYGGRILHAGKLFHGKTSEVFHDGRTIFKGVSRPFVATRYHSLVADRASLPEYLEVSAETADGVIMGLRHREHQVEGVQFHPESILTAEGKRILSNFLALRDGVLAAGGAIGG